MVDVLKADKPVPTKGRLFRSHKEYKMLTRKLIFAATCVLVFAVSDVQAGGDPTKGKELAQKCNFCHGEDGKGKDDKPAIAGLSESYIIEQLKAFKSGERAGENKMMLMFTKKLSDQDMSDLAAYLFALESG